MKRSNGRATNVIFPISEKKLHITVGIDKFPWIYSYVEFYYTKANTKHS